MGRQALAERDAGIPLLSWSQVQRRFGTCMAPSKGITRCGSHGQGESTPDEEDKDERSKEKHE